MQPPLEHAFPLEDDPKPRVMVGLSKLGLALKQQGWKGANRRGLSPTAGQVLVLLSKKEPRRLSEIAADLGLTPATVSDTVKVLVEKNLVLREKEPDNARALALRLSDTGRDEAQHATGWPDFLLGAVDTLSDLEQAVFLRGLSKMLRTLQERGEIPVQAMCVSCLYFRPNQHPDPQRPHHCAYLDAPFGDLSLRLECAEHEAAPLEQQDAQWQVFRSS